MQPMEIRARPHAKFAPRFTKVNAGSKMVAIAEMLVATIAMVATKASIRSKCK